MSSSAIRSSIENSPWSATISVRRWSPKPAATSVSSSFRIFMRRGLEARISLHSLMNLRTSFSSSSSLVISRAVSRASRILRISADCFSDSLKRLRKLASAVGVSLDLRMIYHLVDVVDGDLEAFENVLAVLRALQLEVGATDDDRVAMLDEVLEQRLQGHLLGRAVDQRDDYPADGARHLGVLVERVQHDRRHGSALQLDDDPHPLAVRLVAQVRDALELK